MRYEFMAAHESEHDVKRMCRVLGVSRSSYYAWRSRPKSQRAQANEKLLVWIREEYQLSHQTYGSPRIHAALRRKSVCCSRKRVARLMRLERIVARRARRSIPHTTQRDPKAVPAPNLLNQDFSSPAPDRKWVSDITYIDTAEGWLYLAAILDLFSRRVVGWAMDEHMEASLAQQAWNMAVSHRNPSAELLHHSDQGGQYTSDLYQQSLAAHHCQVSMSRVGNCFDNAAMESFFSTLKTECADQPFETRAQARTTIFEYIEAWYNRQRLHSALDYLSPVEFERQSRHSSCP
jgi:transposase InsO family protein